LFPSHHDCVRQKTKRQSGKTEDNAITGGRRGAARRDSKTPQMSTIKPDRRKGEEERRHEDRLGEAVKKGRAAT